MKTRLRREIHSMKDALDHAYDRYTRALHEVPIDIQQDMHIYMCIRLSGYLEQLLHRAIHAYIGGSASGPAAAFALSYFKHAPNLNPNAFERVIERFGEDWEVKFKAFLDEDDRRGQLGRLLKLRNDAAHGNSYGGSSPSVASYKRLVDEIHRWICQYMVDN